MTDRLQDLRAGLDNDLFDEKAPATTDHGPDLELGQGSTTGVDGKELEKFNREADALRTAINRIDLNTKQLHELYQKPTSDSVTAEIQTLLESTEKKSQAIRKRLKRIADENKEFVQANPNASSTGAIRIKQHQQVTKQFMKAMEDFEREQEVHKGAMQATIMNEMRQMNPEATDEQLQQAVKTGEYDHIVSAADMSAKHSEVQNQLNEIRSRNQDILKLEKDIVELHQMFLDMSLLVENQGELLNSIEYNVAETRQAATDAEIELVAARDNQRAARRKKFLLVLIIICILLAIIIPIVVTQLST